MKPLTPPIPKLIAILTVLLAATLANVSRADGLLPDVIEDRAFDRYVDVSDLSRAWRELDPAGLTDAALQLAEGERILFRSHKAISADEVFAAAIRVAAEKQDRQTLDRLSRALKDRGGPLTSQLDAVLRLGKASRSVGSDHTLPIDTNPVVFAAYKELHDSIQSARVRADTAVLSELSREVDRAEDFDASQKKTLLAMIEDSGEGSADPPAFKLNRLSAAERGWLSDSTPFRTPEPIRKIAPRGISVTPQESYSTVGPAPSGPPRWHINNQGAAYYGGKYMGSAKKKRANSGRSVWVHQRELGYVYRYFGESQTRVHRY